ncbi:MAG TPA: hypothetical protein VF070_16185 [Streptosporangiaceae bacterium]
MAEAGDMTDASPTGGGAAAIEEAAGRVLEMFAAVCGVPDDQEIARQADRALWTLDDLLTDTMP